MRHGDEPRGGRPPTKEEEEQRLQTLMADLEASIATFDARLTDIGADPGLPNYARLATGEAFPTIDPDARREVATIAPVPDTSGSTAAPQTPLLRELAATAGAQGAAALSAAERRRNTAFAIGRSLQQAHDYLQALIAQLNDLQPATPIHFAVDLEHAFTGLRWQEGGIRASTRSLSERSLIEKLTLRTRYAAAALSFTTPDAALRRIENELYLANIAWQDAGGIELTGGVPGRRLDVAGSIPAQLVFTADVAERRIILRCRNLNALGLTAFAIEPAALDSAALDEIGRCLLGQSRRLPASFRPIPFNTPDSKA